MRELEKMPDEIVHQAFLLSLLNTNYCFTVLPVQ
jgi:hypothetical protein